MKTLIKNEIHTNNNTDICLVVLIKEKKLKITYGCYNANEKFTIEIFDGYKWNFFLGISDLGIEADKSMYVRNQLARTQRFETILIKVKADINKIL